MQRLLFKQLFSDLMRTKFDEKKFGRATVRPTVQGATFNMRGQLYLETCGKKNASSAFRLG